MRITLKVGMLLGHLCLCLSPVAAEGIQGPSLRYFLDETGASRACALSDQGDPGVRNVIVWPQDGRLAALIFRANIEQTATVSWPCWTGNGSCVVFEGFIAAETSSCLSGVGLIADTLVGLWKRDPGKDLSPDLDAVVRNLMPIADQLTGAESLVAFLDGHPAFMAEGERGTRQARIIGPNVSFTIARLRISYETLDIGALEDAMSALGTRDLALVGPRGVLATDGRAYVAGTCFEVAGPTEVHRRLVAANEAFPLEVPPSADTADAVHDDIVQGLLGGTVVYGPSVGFIPQQDPLTLLYIDGRTDLCP